MTYALISSTREQLQQRTRTFTRSFEPLLAALEAGRRAGHPAAQIPQVGEYLDVCRWPFRRLEYSFVLDAIETAGRRGLTCLDVGCGATALPHVLSTRGHTVHACDFDGRLIEALADRNLCQLLSTSVQYSAQDATDLQFGSGTFDVVTCVSVLEHIPAPLDRQAVDEMIRVLKPGGLLALTVDYAPGSTRATGRAMHYLRRAQQLIMSEGLPGVRRVLVRKREATAAVAADGGGSVPRSANQPFDWRHLECDVLPRMLGNRVRLARSPRERVDPRTLNGKSARDLWELEPGLFERQGRRLVIPVGIAIRKWDDGARSRKRGSPTP
jgi:2-polyprenyl-3-methyl-5-hydroxy-6-metoxy-1,4-benzoquinol methylase